MKITKEMVNKLPQLDRIELRQKLWNCRLNLTTGLPFMCLILLGLFEVSWRFPRLFFPTIFIGAIVLFLSVYFEYLSFDTEDKIKADYFKEKVLVRRKK